jgi:hypothetical protein
MRDLSVGLGTVQFIFMAMLVSILVWLAAGVTAILLGVWVVFHLIWTLLEPQRPTAVPLPQMSAAAAAEAPAGSWAAPAVAAPTERTNWWGVVAASAVALSLIPFLRSGLLPLAVTLAGIGAVAAIIAMLRPEFRSKLTATAISTSLLAGTVLTILSLAMAVVTQPTTLYGTPYGTDPGTLASIEELNAQLPCVDEPVIPAAAEQERLSFEPDAFTATMSCHISTAEDAQAVVFVQAPSPSTLDEIFASGIVVAGSRFDNDVWVQRDGAVAVITIDEDSADLAQAVGSTWISMNDYEPRTRDQ